MIVITRTHEKRSAADHKAYEDKNTPASEPYKQLTSIDLEAQAKHSAAGPSGGGPYEIGLSPPGPNFQPQHILYYQLRITTNGDDLDNWNFEYPLYGLYEGADIDNFITMVRNQDVPTLAPTSDDPVMPTTITITEPCYVVIELTTSEPTLRFRNAFPAIKTADNHAAQYTQLAHLDSDGTIFYGKANASCRLIYFSVKYVQLDQDHAYNIYLQYGSVPQHVTVKVIDPAIKNRGGDDDARIAMGQQMVERAISRRRQRRRLQKRHADPQRKRRS